MGAGVAHHNARRREEAYDEGAEDAPQYDAPPPAPPAPAPTQAGGDDVAELQRLSQMHDAGQLTDDEFSAAKSKVLGL